MSYQEFNLQDDPFCFLSPQEKLARLLWAYETCDSYRRYGYQSYSYGPEGDQFERMLAEYLGYVDRDVPRNSDDEMLSCYKSACQHYPHFAPILNFPESWEEYIKSVGIVTDDE